MGYRRDLRDLGRDWQFIALRMSGTSAQGYGVEVVEFMILR
jgi:hypothetical protein